MWKWIERRTLFSWESLSSLCRSSNSWWLLFSMKLTNNKVQMQHRNLVKSKFVINYCLAAVIRADKKLTICIAVFKHSLLVTYYGLLGESRRLQQRNFCFSPCSRYSLPTTNHPLAEFGGRQLLRQIDTGSKEPKILFLGYVFSLSIKR